MGFLYHLGFNVPNYEEINFEIFMLIEAKIPFIQNTSVFSSSPVIKWNIMLSFWIFCFTLKRLKLYF